MDAQNWSLLAGNNALVNKSAQALWQRLSKTDSAGEMPSRKAKYSVEEDAALFECIVERFRMGDPEGLPNNGATWRQVAVELSRFDRRAHCWKRR